MDTEEQSSFNKWFDSFRRAFSRMSRYIALTVLWSLFQAVIVEFLWNFTIPVVLQFSGQISFAQSLALVFLVRILSRTWVKDSQVDVLLAQLQHQRFIDNTTYGLLTIAANEYEARNGITRSVPPETPVDKTHLN